MTKFLVRRRSGQTVITRGIVADDGQRVHWQMGFHGPRRAFETSARILAAEPKLAAVTACGELYIVERENTTDHTNL